MGETIKRVAAPGARKSRTDGFSNRRIQILAIVIMVAGLLIFLSIISHAPADEPVLDRLSVTDLVNVIFNEEVRNLVDLLQNRFGLLGALLSDFFINSTVGYASLILPILLFLWGWVMLAKRDTAKPLTITNYAIVFALLVSTAFGIGTLAVGNMAKEWSGIVGLYLATILIKLIGGFGSVIVVFTALFITTVLAIDLDIHRSIERFRGWWDGLKGWIAHRSEPRPGEKGPRMFDEDEIPEEVTIRKTDEEEMEADREIDEEVDEDGEPEHTGEEEREAEEELIAPDVPLRLEQREVEEEEDEVPPPRSSENDDKEIDYVFPSVELLDVPRQSETIGDDELKANAELVRTKLANFGVAIESVSVTPGPVITLYELVPASGVKISRIVSLENDLALALAARGIRIIAPIPGKSAVGVEIPNRNPSIVHIRSLLNSTRFREMKANLPIALGKTISGEVYTDDLAKMPHLLIAGSTGSGKSVGINTILASILFRLHPSDVKFIIIDPKKIELTQYGRLQHHFLAISPDIDEEIVTTPENAVSVLRSVEVEMEKRYDRLAAAGVRNIQDYNERHRGGRLKNTETIMHRKMPYLMVVIDELADLMMTAAREVEEPIARLAQLARAVGIHLVLATQRPSVDVITGVIKANFPARIAYQVASKIDSRTILDMNGAEQLLGSGDMLYLPSGSPKPVRIQNAFISTDEVERLTDHIARQQGYGKPFHLPSILEKKRAGMRGTQGSRDEFFGEAARLIVRHQQGSVSLLQRRLKVGYSRAARLVDELEAAGIVGPFDGSKAREVLCENEQQLNVILRGLDE